MRIDQHEQGTEGWRLARCGLPTSSNFHRIVTPAKLKPSSAQKGYAHELLAEWLTGIPTDSGSSAFMERGTEMEGRARGWYSFEYGVEVVEVGLCLSDDGRYGASPDGLVGEDVVLEIKCLSAAKHIGYLLDGPGTDHRLQRQGQLFVTGRPTSDLLAYNPRIASRLVVEHADPDAQAALGEHVPRFCDELDKLKGRLRALGCVPACERAPVTSFAAAAGVPDDVSFDDVLDAVGEARF